MQKRKRQQPSYRQRKGYDQAIVTLTDSVTRYRKDYWLGPYDSSESRELYHRVLAQWESGGRRLPVTLDDKPADLTLVSISEVLNAYWKWASTYYGHSELSCLRMVIRLLRQMFGSTSATDFGPNRLRLILEQMIVGDQSADDEGHENLRLLDLSLTTWGELGLGGMSTGRSRAYIPIVIFSNYRRISPQDAGSTLLDAFNVTVFGLGLGLGLESVLGEKVFFEARANPGIGFATSSLTDAFGSTYLIDADGKLHLAQLFGAVGLSLGYSFRFQVWNVNSSNLFPDAADEFFDYKGRQHLFRVGVNW